MPATMLEAISPFRSQVLVWLGAELDRVRTCVLEFVSGHAE
jgi:hypothetical protein